MNKWVCVIAFILVFCKTVSATTLTDSEIIPIQGIRPAIVHKEYNYKSLTKIPIKLRPVKEIFSEKDVYEGQQLSFRVVKDVYYKGQWILDRGQIIHATVKLVIKPGMNGIPASIILGDFRCGAIKQGVLTNEYEIFGQDRSLLVFPLKWALTILPPTGSLTNFIMGGHAKIKVDKTLTIYYYPEWL